MSVIKKKGKSEGSKVLTLVCSKCGTKNRRNIFAQHLASDKCHNCHYELPKVSGIAGIISKMVSSEISLNDQIVYFGIAVEAPKEIDLRLLKY